MCIERALLWIPSFIPPFSSFGLALNDWITLTAFNTVGGLALHCLAVAYLGIGIDESVLLLLFLALVRFPISSLFSPPTLCFGIAGRSPRTNLDSFYSSSSSSSSTLSSSFSFSLPVVSFFLRPRSALPLLTFFLSYVFRTRSLLALSYSRFFALALYPKSSHIPPPILRSPFPPRSSCLALVFCCKFTHRCLLSGSLGRSQRKSMRAN